MKADAVRKQAFSMPLHSPSYPPGPYRFVNREFLIITYRTDRAALERVVPKPLEIVDPIVKYEFIRMPDSTGFGDYTEFRPGDPGAFAGEIGGYVHAMFLDDDPPIAGGRELWGFPRSSPFPTLRVSAIRCSARSTTARFAIATGSMGYKHKPVRATPSCMRWKSRVPAQDHSACRRHAAHLRARALPSREIDLKGAWRARPPWNYIPMRSRR